MRYLLQFLVPALVVIIVALVFFRNRGTVTQQPQSAAPKEDHEGPGTGTMILILVIAAAFTIALVYGLQGITE
jgi:hypothetical protein